jgi:hypothetical protein
LIFVNTAAQVDVAAGVAEVILVIDTAPAGVVDGDLASTGTELQ